MIRVELNEVAELYLLISHPTGVTYSHQCAGYGCYHNELEGYLVPLSHTDAISKQLYKYFYEDSKWKGHCYSGIDEETAVAVEEILAANYSTLLAGLLSIELSLVNRLKPGYTSQLKMIIQSFHFAMALTNQLKSY